MSIAGQTHQRSPRLTHNVLMYFGALFILDEYVVVYYWFHSPVGTEWFQQFPTLRQDDPTDPAAWNNRGNALLGLQRFEEAKDSFQQALDISGLVLRLSKHNKCHLSGLRCVRTH